MQNFVNYQIVNLDESIILILQKPHFTIRKFIIATSYLSPSKLYLIFFYKLNNFKPLSLHLPKALPREESKEPALSYEGWTFYNPKLI